MPVVEHNVSYRNGTQIMVAGLDPSLLRMGYRRGAQVRVTDPNRNPANIPWEYVVPNDEHATLVSQNPAPPNWIQPGVRVRIEVRPPEGVRVANNDPPRTGSLLTWAGRHLAQVVVAVIATIIGAIVLT